MGLKELTFFAGGWMIDAVLKNLKQRLAKAKELKDSCSREVHKEQYKCLISNLQKKIIDHEGVWKNKFLIS